MWNPPDPKTFNAIVWDIVKQIPRGRVSTYGQIASMIPAPDDVEPPQYDRLGPRWVGQAMAAVPDDSIPWQRVINSKGEISERPMAAEQRRRLEAEGVVFDESNRVDFNVYAWDGPDAAWLNAHDLFPPKPLRKKSTDEDNEQLSLF
ncbi:MAG: 6-O-methylguanine DNA methyltransferase [Chloroflexi bacterium]|nr:MAG: 6-O-methylguanine DNA methyltransferase [Chloroflexota bacterium]